MKILRAREIWPSTGVTGRTSAELAAESSWGEPADYFEHVMFAHGRCTAPEAVAMSRRLGRDLVPTDLDAGYSPAVRFYVSWRVLLALPNSRFDGVHPMMTFGGLSLPDVLVAVAVHAEQTDPVLTVAPSWARIIVLDTPSPTPATWASAALEAVRSAD